MPELPEVETVAKALHKALRGRVVRGARFLGRLRRPFDEKVVAKALAGRKIVAVRRRAKYLIVEFDGKEAMLAHLGMTGFFHIERAEFPLLKHDRVALALDRGDELRFADARRFGFVEIVPLPGPGGCPEELAGLGLEPLERGFTARSLLDLARGRSSPVKVFLMDQRRVVGVGNIYASEALYRARIDPRRPAGGLDAAEWKRLAAAVRAVLREALRAGGSTIRNYRGVDGSEGSFQRRLRIYGRGGENCSECGTAVAVLRQGGRSTFYCPSCQH